MMSSAIYEGNLRHRRRAPRAHTFRYPLFLMYLDLAELPEVFDGRWFWSARRPALGWFRRRDYFGDPAVPLDRTVRDLVEQRTGRRPQGPIRLLTHLRYFGYGFNPVSFYYCFDRGGETVEAIVAEITNTPWKERHCYVLATPDPGGPPGALSFGHEKEFHVSPFMPMEQHYRWRFTQPTDRLAVHVENHQEGEKIFDATLTLKRRPLTAGNLARVLMRYPGMTLQVVARIHLQALRLWWKRVPFHVHPAKQSPARRSQERAWNR